MQLENYGLSQIILPFLLIFIILFSIFQKAKILSEKKQINMAISIVIALIPIVIHATGRLPERYDPVNIINQAIPGIALVIVSILSFLLIIGIFGGKIDFNYGAVTIWTAGLIGIFIVNTLWYNNLDFSFLVSMIIMTVGIFLFFKTGFPGLYDIIASSMVCFILYMFGRTAGWFSEVPFWIRDSRYVGVGIVVLVIMSIIAYATKSDKE